MKRNHRLFVKDILDSIEKIEEFIGNMDFKKFIEDDKTRSAVVRKLEEEGTLLTELNYSEVGWRFHHKKVGQIIW